MMFVGERRTRSQGFLFSRAFLEIQKMSLFSFSFIFVVLFACAKEECDDANCEMRRIHTVASTNDRPIVMHGVHSHD